MSLNVTKQNKNLQSPPTVTSPLSLCVFDRIGFIFQEECKLTNVSDYFAECSGSLE